MIKDYEIEPAWERRGEVGFFKSIFLTIRGVMFRPSETFSNFRWDGGYWNPILLNLLATGITVVGVLLLTNGILWIKVADFKNFLNSLSFALLWVPSGLVFTIAPLFLFSIVVFIALRVLSAGLVAFQSVFRVVAYTSILVCLLQAMLDMAIDWILPRVLWDPIQYAIEILMMIWQGYCIAVALSKATPIPFWKPMFAVAIAMTLAFGAQEMTSISNPVGQKIWGGIYHGITGNHSPS